MERATTTERSRPMKRTRNGILIPDVPIMAGGNLPNAVKGVGGGIPPHTVDLGLPSGNLWADADIYTSSNDGFAESAFAEDLSYFSWANVDGYNLRKESHCFGEVNNNPPYYQGQIYGTTTGCQLQGNIDSNVEYNAARVYLGGRWTIPSLSDFEELFDNCDSINSQGEIVTENVVVTVNNVKGVFLRSKINGKTIFMSAAGQSGDICGFFYNNERVCRWISSYIDERNAYSILIQNGIDGSPITQTARTYARPIRAIWK